MIKACDRWIVKNPWIARICVFLAFTIPGTLALVLTDAPAWIFVFLYLLFVLASFGRVIRARNNIIKDAIDKLDNECDPYPLKEACDFLLEHCGDGAERDVIMVNLAVFYSEIGDNGQNLEILKGINLEAGSALPVVKCVYYNNLASGYAEGGELDRADVCYESACKTLEGIKNKKQRASVEKRLEFTAAWLEYNRGNYERAFEMYQSLECDSARKKVHRAFVCARCQLALGNRAAAELGLRYAVESGNKLAVVEEARRLLAENNT